MHIQRHRLNRLPHKQLAGSILFIRWAKSGGSIWLWNFEWLDELNENQNFERKFEKKNANLTENEKDCISLIQNKS